jgi:transposase
MARPLLDDELWNVIEPLLPPPKPRRFKCPGRKPLDRRKALTGVLFVLKTGIPWEDLPQEMGCGSGMSCWRYLNAWQEAGVWEKVHNALLGRLRAKERLDLSAAMVDSSHVRAVGGANVRDPAL